MDARWLLHGSLRCPLPGHYRAGLSFGQACSEDYSKEVFDRVRAAREAKQPTIPEGEHTREEQVICLLFRLACIYSSARANGEEVMALYRSITSREISQKSSDSRSMSQLSSLP